MRVLTKSIFKLALECPNKLFYTKKTEYANQKEQDTFLQSLAEGGFQVEELARMHYPEGELLEGKDGDYEFLHQWTERKLKNEKQIIFEAAFLHENFFVRTDILIKEGNRIKIVEVKAKSFQSDDDYLFIGKKGGITSSWKPYLFDLAFQVYVVKKCYPSFEVSAYFMLADKNKTASIDGLNQLFRISSDANNRTGVLKLVKSVDEIGDSVLGEVCVDSIIERILSDRYRYNNALSFGEAVEQFRKWYLNDTYPNWPLSFGACKSCEFRSKDHSKKSGYHECFKKQKGWIAADLEKPNIFDIWNFRKGNKLFEEGKFFLEDFNISDIGLKEKTEKLSTSERQWIQIEKAVHNDLSVYVDMDGLKDEMDSWKWPLHFIDFETSAVALPFTKGMSPYEQVAFQFSHHKLESDGTISHESEFLSNRAGHFPNFEFVRALKASLSVDDGTIFRFSNHENTILNAIYNQLLNSAESDKEELLEFIQSITQSKNSSVEKWNGNRNMVDLCQVIKDYYYNPLTKGSNSIKAVLPAALTTSSLLQEKYTKPLSAINVTSKNFPSDHIWLKKSNGEVVSPYLMLPPLFEGWTEEEMERSISEMESLADGGAALTAFGKLQYQDMSDEERQSISDGLLKYCELDTLAMVMIFEHLNELITE